MPIEKRRVCFRTFAVVAASVVPGLLLTACASPSRSDAREHASPASQALVFATPVQRSVLALDTSEPPSDSWAFSRNDYALAVREPAPLLATNQWPEIPPPLERPVWFHRWVQR